MPDHSEPVRPSLGALRALNKGPLTTYAEELSEHLVQIGHPPLDLFDVDTGKSITADKMRDAVRDAWVTIDNSPTDPEPPAAAASSPAPTGTDVPEPEPEPEPEAETEAETDPGPAPQHDPEPAPVPEPRAKKKAKKKKKKKAKKKAAAAPSPAPAVAELDDTGTFRIERPAPEPAPKGPPAHAFAHPVAGEPVIVKRAAVSGIAPLSGGTVRHGSTAPVARHVPPGVLGATPSGPQQSGIAPVASAVTAQENQPAKRPPPYVQAGRDGLAPALGARPIVPSGAISDDGPQSSRANELVTRPIVPRGALPPVPVRAAPPAPVRVERAATGAPVRATAPGALSQIRAAKKSIEMARGAVLDWPDDHPHRSECLEATTELLRVVWPVVQRIEEVGPKATGPELPAGSVASVATVSGIKPLSEATTAEMLGMSSPADPTAAGGA